MTDPLQPASPEEPAASQPAWGAPQTTPSLWTTRKTLATVGVAAAIAAVGGGVIYAASGSSTGDHRGPGGPGMSMNDPGMNSPGGSNNGGGSFSGPMGGALHGQFVVSDGNGDYTTELTQTGTVTAVSADSITAKSADNYTHTYTIGSDTRETSGVKVGDTVSIRATDANGTSTTTVVTEGTAARPGGGRWNRMDGTGGPGAMNGAAAPNQMSSGPGQFGPGAGNPAADPVGAPN
ncbi:hypothetical protein KO481_28820 [Nocardia sp. NEAU-G5]|uniref:DUF5666 domain-containing protein n=1 Tax=Nocardia albiluteola TaxID=2842303 RepID=A0ABS6AXP4_9NOCA|nr:hypothetical protein [Nocardia albiluteola]MBU3062648.1 hypothetical protein [Nocardia albiluteola]MBU3065518.1 hypothetical protein [Nocardia albiluteola]